MDILPLGGASEVGASSALLDVDGSRILIDAGIRVGSGSKKGALPAFDRIGEPPDAAVITHAHTDHTGGLPHVEPYLGDALVHMTVPTLHLLEILQRDAVRHNSADDADSGRVPFTVEQVENAISRIVTHAYHRPFCPVPGRDDIVFEYLPCGHILGAAMLLIDTPNGRLLWTGDYSVSGQVTIGGFDLEMLAERREERSIDVVVTEGTYGNDVHPPLERETRDFLKLLERTTAQGGKVLIPAFAVGRAQDITKVIRDAKLDGRLEGVPLYLDGMVRPVTSIYENIVHETYPAIEEPLTLLDPKHRIYKANNGSRTKLTTGAHEGPAIVVASSGMLIGGRSVQYARAFASDPDNAILISGYQDEEAPGRELLDLKRGGRLRLGEDWTTVQCQVGRYHTSAHADAEQVERVVRTADPRKVLLVHGEVPSLKALKQGRLSDYRPVILQNKNPYPLTLRSDADDFEPHRERSASVAVTPLETGPRPTETEVRTLWERLAEADAREYAEAEIARLFLGPNYTPAERDVLSDHLADHRLYFITGGRLGQRSYRPRPAEELSDMLVERASAYQVPIERGDVILFSDGSPDLFAAAVQEVEGDHVQGIVPFSPRHGFRRDWLRCKTALNIERLLDHNSVGYCLQWLDGVVREARALPDCDPVDAWEAARESEEGAIDAAEAVGLFFQRREGMYSSAMHVATGLALSGADQLFRLQPDGSFVPRPPEEVVERWPDFERIRHVRDLEDGAVVVMRSGRRVTPTGVYYPDSFEARVGEESFTRCNYRHVVLPREPTPEPPEVDEGDGVGGGTPASDRVLPGGEAPSENGGPPSSNGRRKVDPEKVSALRKRVERRRARRLAEAAGTEARGEGLP